MDYESRRVEAQLQFEWGLITRQRYWEIIAEINREEKEEKEKEKEKERRNSENNSHPHNTPTGCLIVMGFMTAFAGLSGIAAAKTISNAIDTKQPEGPKATLVSKSSVQKPKNLDTEHTKD